MKALKQGEKTTLPNGKTITFLEVNIEAMTDSCEGCVLDVTECLMFDDITGPCGTGRPDGKIGIFVECKD